MYLNTLNKLRMASCVYGWTFNVSLVVALVTIALCFWSTSQSCSSKDSTNGYDITTYVLLGVALLAVLIVFMQYYYGYLIKGM